MPALGFGFTEPVSADLVDRILEVYRAEGNPYAVLQFAPEVRPDDWPEIARTRGLEPSARIAKLAAPVEQVRAPGATDLRVAPVARQDAEQWAAAVSDGFGKPHEGFVGMLTAAAGHSRTHAYAVWDGDRVAGGGMLHVHGDLASLNHGAVLARYRRRGGQSALVAARTGRARELGCRWIVTEAFQPDDGRSSSSLNNMVRAGLRKLYVRQNCLWRG